MRLTEEHVQMTMSSWYKSPEWFLPRFASKEEETRHVVSQSSKFYIALDSEGVTDAEFRFAAFCANKRLRKIPAIADLLDYVQEYRSRSPVQPPLALPAAAGCECRDIEGKISVRMLSKIGKVAENLPESEQRKLWEWWHGVAAEGVEEVLDRLAAGELSVDELTVL
jgi:hypothetical protein